MVRSLRALGMGSGTLGNGSPSASGEVRMPLANSSSADRGAATSFFGGGAGALLGAALADSPVFGAAAAA